jgi:hypothetical protein
MFRRMRSPSPALVIATLALFVALGGPGYAAKAVKKVAFAKTAGNAKKVGGIKASRRPQANRLLALDANARFPASVFPPGAQGAQGAQGPQGTQGPKGDKGDAGAVGPTAGAVSPTGGTATGGTQSASTTITMPRAGSLWIAGVDNYSTASCTGGNGSFTMELYVDGTFVPGSQRSTFLPDSPAQRGMFTTYGLATGVGAGPHDVVMRDQISSCSGAFGVDAKVTAIALG